MATINSENMTYKSIKERYKAKHGVSISDCAIADAKRKLGIKVKIATNRINQRRIKHGCSSEQFKNLKTLFKKYKIT